ncbi:MarR family winged helix-turn-helix transcriptional regulator [Foetidibacter luteolus]|uniref:MarR family winged helix-turn-helix transcriptional regulator n=1 Tax=Foetidibacter luteolus TaxID=2608880 RepID=UPI00129B03CC|nr:MarR family transcriptional regulator [Foetidibacter luteolus]
MNFYQQLGFLVFGSRLKRLGETLIGDINKIYQSHRIAFDASWFPVFYILSQKQQVSIKEIADELNVSHSAVSQLISSLQQKGFIASVVSKEDARHRAITFTAEGEKLLAKIQPVWQALEKAMQNLAQESPESVQLLGALTALENNLQQEALFDRIEKNLN